MHYKMFVRAKIAKRTAHYCLVESERMSGEPKPLQRTKHYLGNYTEAKVTLSTLDISLEQQQRFAARIDELEALAVAKRQREPRSRRRTTPEDRSDCRFTNGD